MCTEEEEAEEETVCMQVRGIDAILHQIDLQIFCKMMQNGNASNYTKYVRRASKVEKREKMRRNILFHAHPTPPSHPNPSPHPHQPARAIHLNLATESIWQNQFGNRFCKSQYCFPSSENSREIPTKYHQNYAHNWKILLKSSETVKA